MRILVHSPVGLTTGYGRDGVGLVMALLNAGHDVDLVPSAVNVPVPSEVADLLSFYPDGHYDLEIHHVPPTGATSRSMGIGEHPPRKRVLWTMWEWDTFPESVESYDRAANYVSSYDHVVLYTEQTREAFEGAGMFDKHRPPISIVQGGFEPDSWFLPTDKKAIPFGGGEMDRSKARDTFRFGMVGVLGIRKNPYNVIQAFVDLKSEHGEDFDAVLLLKTDFPLVPNSFDVPDISIIQNVTWKDEQLRAFYWNLDCLINVSWGEGKDLPALEATMCGTPTILNDTPGHQGWIHPGIQKLIPAVPMYMDPEYRGRYTGRKEIKEAMWEAYTNRVPNFRRAKQLADYVERRVSWEHRIKKFGEAIGVTL